PGKFVVQGDVIGNTEILTMNIANGTSGPILAALGPQTSKTSITCDSGVLVTQSIYARNGQVCVPQPCVDTSFPPGTNITLRSYYILPTGTFDFLSFTFFLPYPLMDANNVTSFMTMAAGAYPPPFTDAKYGPDDTFYS